MKVHLPRQVAPGAASWALAGLTVALALSVVGLRAEQPPQRPEQPAEGFRFKSSVELINVTATVTDSTGRFVRNLRKDDFLVYEDGQRQEITHFSNERVPVSLGIVIDSSGSMQGRKWDVARAALDRFLYELLDPNDEIFIYRFSGDPELVQDWTTDRRRLSRALAGISPSGGTALYDAVAEAVPMAHGGKNRKKAIVVISDGNDTSSRTHVGEIKQLVRETEVLVYAIGIDARGQPTFGGMPRFPRQPTPFPFPIPGRRQPWPPPIAIPPPSGGSVSNPNDRVNVAALRELSDDSGGRTEVVDSLGDLDPATAGIADELSRQYYLGYPSPGKRDGRWHAIRVEVRDRALRVRARRGYVAT